MVQQCGVNEALKGLQDKTKEMADTLTDAVDLEKLRCPHCGKYDTVHYVQVDQREKYNRRWE